MHIAVGTEDVALLIVLPVAPAEVALPSTVFDVVVHFRCSAERVEFGAAFLRVIPPVRAATVCSLAGRQSAQPVGAANERRARRLQSNGFSGAHR